MIPIVDFDTFWKISTLVALTYSFTLVKDVSSNADSLKSKITENLGIDPSGLNISPPADVKLLLEYKVNRPLSQLLLCVVLSSSFVLAYGIFKSIPPPWENEFFDGLIAILTYVGLLPAIIAFFIGIKLSIYILRLYQKANSMK